ncbi:MAG: 2-dehydropantoate 2-reductase [Verrucomicrobiia bacterium]
MASPPLRTIGIAGSGAVGLFYGARLARTGFDVRFLMRRDLPHAQRHGIQVRSPEGDFHLPRPTVAGSGADLGPCDLVLVTAKTTQTDSLLPHLHSMLHSQSTLLTLQNGLGPEETLATAFPHHTVHRGVCFVCLNRTGPAEVTHLRHGSVGIGAFRPEPDPALPAVAAAFEAAGISCKLAPHLNTLLWKKLVWNIPFNGLGIAAGGIGTAAILASPDLSARARRLMAEVIAVANALGCSIPDTLIDHQFAQTEVMGDYLPSSVLDYLAGHPVELDAIWSEPLRRAQATSVPTPELRRLETEIRHRLTPLTSNRVGQTENRAPA